MGWGVGIVGRSDNLVHFIGTLMAMGCRVTAHRRFWQGERARTRYLEVDVNCRLSIRHMDPKEK